MNSRLILGIDFFGLAFLRLLLDFLFLGLRDLYLQSQVVLLLLLQLLDCLFSEASIELVHQRL